MAADSSKNTGVPQEQLILNKETNPEAARHSSADVSENKNNLITNVNKDDKTADKKKNRRKVLDQHYDKLAKATPEKLFAKNSHLKDVSTAITLQSEAHEYMARGEDDDLAYLEHHYDDEKLSEHDLLELGARETYA
ncbi:hypothetical protein FAGAP_3663 [Fusarium agapanthi]|uniref:Uncharacterized protein n=1 Tax=Fusarium agapanthi TaxID=1803897 RepID=A0A9P5BET4_9HYPO|nr:hypothetical protein FAGAP_3663 [Fusarium agapanthi]